MSKYSSYILYLLLSILVVITYINGFGPTESLQRSIDDALCQLTAPEGTRDHVVIVKIDDRAENEFGEWPWNRDILADLIAATAIGEPKVIVVNTDLSEDSYQDSAGYTSILAGQLSWMNNVVLPYDVALATFRSQKTNNPEFLFYHSISVDNPLGEIDENSSLIVRKIFLPAEKLLESKPLLGFTYVRPDKDRILRHQPLVMQYEGYCYPSLSLIAAAAYFGVPTSKVTIREGREIAIGTQQNLTLNDHGEYFINHLQDNSITTFSAADILSDDFNRSVLSGKVVVIEATSSDENNELVTPMNQGISTGTLRATIIENIINNNLLSKINKPVVNMLVLFALGALFAFVLPLLTLRNRFLLLTALLIITAGFNYYLVSSLRILPETIYIAIELLLFIIAAPFLDSGFITGAKSNETDELLFKANKSASDNTSPQPIVVDPPVNQHANHQRMLETETLGSTSGEYPTDHQTIDIDRDLSEENTRELSLDDNSETVATPETDVISNSQPVNPDMSQTKTGRPAIVGFDDSSLDVTPKAAQSGELQQTSQSQPLPAGAPDHLGRYQITENLGKGAMGMVYKGIDPAINRPVALKTIRLDFVNDPEEMEELKERLFREAQAAGKLSHPNIVTIYDVGSEEQLQYIAMEYLEGQTLEDMIKRKTQFNYKIIAQIVIQICSALQYAHDQGIVHRDVKPANIMILKNYQVKVMDYGIARIDSNSMTKTGIAMGTPNYISPEQLRGQKTDSRADLFSLGVVMYEMLLGKRPFKGENITSLIYSIMNHEPEKPSTVNPQIPLLFDRIIWKTLEKNPDARYQKASEIATALNDFVESFTTS
ncbi:MAG: hypothetical protein DRP47_04420 [Candidatus Zixiibacteriota bacterium]|nr:MAG: hypothetical protein DRP47_04420 [candidate division Zixibacteria bacterium]